ncbi:G-type lectin S-receptor-like serine/threonine-protein kinase LECRK3 [Juglans regia]|uniref:Receptor-like serine/threonine-protein kinase n=1 Tax=Juglans regia TaxID=51240 RepID=A0A6P9EWH5_JUGRE|nr:G-type lectin S-receptor-like serine/threonine-protein kinase LECRK3 [Juglans regia]
MQASVVLSFLLLLVLSMANAQQRNFNLSRGSSLSPTGNSSLFSQSGTFAFGFFPFGGGFAVGIWYEGTPQKTVVWTANRNDPPVSRNATIGLTNDGRLILQEVGGQEKTIANTTEPALFVSLLDPGNLVLYNSNSKIIWQSFDYPTDTLLPGLLLRAGDQLVSSISETNHSMGSFRIKMQTDGNIVMYPVGSLDAPDYAYWAAATNFVGKNATLTQDGNGRLYMLNSSGAEVKNINNGAVPSDGKMYRATIDADGIFRVYSHNLIENGSQSIEWSVPDDRCTPKGICGINGYCDLVSLQPVCACPPGFVFINQEQRNLGCNRNFIAESCAFKNDHTEYTIQELQNIVWIESTYAILSSVTREECNLACLEDCNCEAAQFQGQECKKQKLPLTFGRRTQQDQAGNPSPTTLVKVGMDSGRNGTMDPKESRKVLRMDILVIGVACLSFALIVLAFSAFLIFRYRLWAYKKIPYKTNDQGLIEDVTLRAFTYNELEVATSGFSEQLGKGAFGTVFKGTLSGQRTIAVKRLHQEMVADGEVEFRNEMRSIGRTHHRNLVRLLGYCHDGSNRLLVYEYMSNGTLSGYLLKSQLKPNWEERINIALDIARGILYLHEECETRIIHCDLNPNNILMDEYGCAKIADFGVAKLLIPDHSRTLTGVRGTRGYVAPEWHKGMPITVKADIFSFGIMFFVIICCRKSVDNDALEGEAILVKWVNDCFEADELSKLVPDEVDQQSLKRMIKIGLWCIEEDPEVRPSIKKVIQMLEGTIEIAEPPSTQSSFQH